MQQNWWEKNLWQEQRLEYSRLSKGENNYRACLHAASGASTAIETWVVGAWAGEVRRGGERGKNRRRGMVVYIKCTASRQQRQPHEPAAL